MIGRNDFLALGYVPKEALKLKKDKLLKLLELVLQLSVLQEVELVLELFSQV
jgi:hypothetical protein